jgi:hypothetical protein
MAAFPERMRRRMLEVVARIRVTRFCGLMVILLLPGIALTQEVFSGGSEPKIYSDQYSASCQQNEPPNVYKQAGMNPLVCHGQSGPQDSRKRCSYRGMREIAHIGETCYYCAPIVPPINGIIVPYSQVPGATNQGFKCSVDQVDPDCMAICSKSGDLAYTPPGSNGYVPAPKSGPPIVYSTPFPGPLGGDRQVAGPDPCMAGPGYNYCDNGPGARLPAGCICSNPGPGGGLPPTARQPVPQKPLNGNLDICDHPPEEGNNQALNQAWYQWCIDWQKLLEEKVAKPLTAQFGNVLSPPGSKYKYVQITYDAKVRITNNRQATVVGQYTYWSSDGNRTGFAFAQRTETLFNQLKGQVPPFPAGSKYASIDRPQAYTMHLSNNR